MQDPFIANLCSCISIERLAPYLSSDIVQNEMDAVALYIYNAELAEALYPALQNLEITLRNSLHNAIATELGSANWLQTHKNLLHTEAQEDLDNAARKLAKGKKPIEEGRLIAELNFGFWHALFFTHYEEISWWPKLLAAVFPNMYNKIRSRKFVLYRLTQLKDLRNRIFHYEPIWYWQDIAKLHWQLIDTITWINHDIAFTTLVTDRFLAVHSRGFVPYRDRLQSFLKDRAHKDKLREFLEEGRKKYME